MTDLHEHVAAVTTRTIATRRDLHQHPEVAFEETRTMGVIAARLSELGLEPRSGLGRTGVVAVWDTGRPGPTVLARADMDALPVPDEKDVDYRSQFDGKNHACGHDGHVAILLSVAEVLMRRSDALRGRVVFVFQPAEEIFSGAKAMLSDGALDGLDIDHVLGLHLSSMNATGEIALRAGPAMAAADMFRISIHGHGGHAARPNETVDTVLVSAHVILALQSLVSRETDPVDQAVLSITRTHGGTAFNIIPELVELGGTLRTYSEDTRATLKQRIIDVCTGVAAAHRASAEIEWVHGCPVAVNDVAASERVREVAGRVVGPENVVLRDKNMGGDDMALWLQQAPGCYFFVGARAGDATGWPHHHPRFDVDESALPIAVEVLAAGIEDALGRDAKK